MSGWKVLCLEPVKSRRDATDDEDSYDGYHNPNRAIYEHQYGDPYDDPDGMPAGDRMKQILVEEHRAMVDSKHGVVFASMGGYDANWEQALRDTFLMWDKAAVIEANDTSDTGRVHVYDRTWDATRGSRAAWQMPGQALPTNLMADEQVFHETRHDAIGAAAKYSRTNLDYEDGADAWHHSHADSNPEYAARPKANCVYDLDVVYVDGAWMVYADEVWASAQGDEMAQGRHPLYEISAGLGRHSPPLSNWKVDEYQEVECRDGRPVGEKAAAYAHVEWNIHTRAGTPLGWNWDHTRAEPLEWRYKVCMGVPEDTETFPGLFGEAEAGNRVMESDHRYHTRHDAIAHAANLERETGLDTWVEPVPVSTSWAGGIDREFDPLKYPDYKRGALDHDPRPEQYRHD